MVNIKPATTSALKHDNTNNDMNLTQPQQFEVCGKTRETPLQLYSQISHYISILLWLIISKVRSG